MSKEALGMQSKLVFAQNDGVVTAAHSSGHSILAVPCASPSPPPGPTGGITGLESGACNRLETPESERRSPRTFKKREIEISPGRGSCAVLFFSCVSEIFHLRLQIRFSVVLWCLLLVSDTIASALFCAFADPPVSLFLCLPVCGMHSECVRKKKD